MTHHTCTLLCVGSLKCSLRRVQLRTHIMCIEHISTKQMNNYLFYYNYSGQHCTNGAFTVKLVEQLHNASFNMLQSYI